MLLRTPNAERPQIHEAGNAFIAVFITTVIDTNAATKVPNAANIARVPAIEPNFFPMIARACKITIGILYRILSSSSGHDKHA